MIFYVPTSNSDVAASLSDAMWGLSLPLSLRGANVTQRLFGTVVDKDGGSWLAVDTECAILVHPDAEMGEIADILLGAGLPQGEVDQLGKLIVALRGQRMTPWNYFPDVFKAAAKTRAEMIAAGLLTEVTSLQTSPAT